MKIGSCLPNIFSQVIYSGGYSDGEPPLPIPNREAKPVIADGTARPGGRVGSRRALKESSDERSSGDSFSCLWVSCENIRCTRHMAMRVSLWTVLMIEPCLSVSLFCRCPIYMSMRVSLCCSCCRCMFESVLVMRLSTPHVHAGVAAACPCGRTLRSWSDVFPCPQAPGRNWPDRNTGGIDNYPVCLRHSG